MSNTHKFSQYKRLNQAYWLNRKKTAISKKSKFASDVVVSNPFPKQFFHKDDANLTDAPHLAIGIIHSAAETATCERFVIYNNAIFKEWIKCQDIN
jgi:hypothetical protein